MLKLQKQTHINHFANHKTRNIFRIWIFNQQKLICTKNVLFNNDASYDVYEINLMQIIQKLILKTIYDLLHFQYYTRVSEVEINEKKNKDNRLTKNNENLLSISKIVDYFFIFWFFKILCGICTPTISINLSKTFLQSSALFALNTFSLNQFYLQPHTSTTNATINSQMIEFDLNKINIFFEKIRRR